MQGRENAQEHTRDIEVSRRGGRRIGSQKAIVSPYPMPKAIGSKSSTDPASSRATVTNHTRIRCHAHLMLLALGYRIVTPHQPEARHPYWQLLYTHRAAARLCCGQHTLNLVTRRACLIPPFTKYRVVPLTQPACWMLNIGFSFGFGPDGSPKNNSPWQTIEVESAQGLCDDLDRIALTLANTKAFDSVLLQCFVIQLLARFIDRGTRAKLDRSQLNRNGTLAGTIKRMIAQNITRPYGIKELSQLLNRSEHHLSHVFKQATGMTIKEYHDKLRFDIAARLLTEGNRSVTQIADELGFDSLHSFSRRFKTAFGQSPLNFRRERNRASGASRFAHMP